MWLGWGRRWMKGGWKKQSDGRRISRRADGGLNEGMRVKEKKISEVEQWWGGNRLSCSPGKGDLSVSVGLCYSPDVSLIGLWNRKTRSAKQLPTAHRPTHAPVHPHNCGEFTDILVNELEGAICYFQWLAFLKKKKKTQNKLLGSSCCLV